MADFQICDSDCRFWGKRCVLTGENAVFGGACALPVPVCGPVCVWYRVHFEQEWCDLAGDTEDVRILPSRECRRPGEFRAALLRALVTGDRREK